MRDIDIKKEVKFYLMMIRSYHFAQLEIVECRLELGDIELKFQPIQAYRTDREVLQHYFKENTKHIYEKIKQEEAVKKRFDDANLILERCEEIMKLVVDPLEKEMIEFLYMNKRYPSRNEFARKYDYDVGSVYHKIHYIIKKAVKRKRKLRNM